MSAIAPLASAVGPFAAPLADWNGPGPWILLVPVVWFTLALLFVFLVRRIGPGRGWGPRGRGWGPGCGGAPRRDGEDASPEHRREDARHEHRWEDAGHERRWEDAGPELRWEDDRPGPPGSAFRS
jgi:hypothetical protein